MFRIYYYIFGLDGIPRYVYWSELLKLKLSKEKTSFLPLGWNFDTMNREGFDECVKMDAKEIYDKYQCPAYVFVEHERDNYITSGPLTEDDYNAVRLSNRFDRLVDDEYQKWLKSARQ